jgi:hypothetical protein
MFHKKKSLQVVGILAVSIGAGWGKGHNSMDQEKNTGTALFCCRLKKTEKLYLTTE